MSQPQAESAATDIIKATAEKWGFCLLKGLFTAEEVAEIERCMARESENFATGFPDLYSVPSLRWLLSEPRIQNVARRLLGPELVYYRVTNIAYEAEPGPITNNPYGELHCDARGMADSLNSADYSTPTSVYPAYRFAIYCRDYTHHSGGLKVALGSHLMPYLDVRQCAFPDYIMKLPMVRVQSGDFQFSSVETPFQLHNIPSAPGDVVIFNLRTFHAAGAVRFVHAPQLAVLPSIERHLRKKEIAAPYLAPRAPGPRNAVFFDFTSPSPTTDLYIKWCASRTMDEKRLIPINTAPTDGFVVRNDISMVNHVCYLREQALARGIDLTKSGLAWPLPPPLDKVAEQLLTMCATHREFSPHHALVNPHAYAAAAMLGPAAALSYAVNAISSMLDEAARDLATLKVPA